MDVFLIVRHKKTTLFLDTRENQLVYEVKRMLHGLLKVDPRDQQLHRETDILDDSRPLTDYGITASTARAHQPCLLVLTIRDPVTEQFEVPELVPYSTPPELPEVMRAQDSSSHPPEPQVQS